MIYKPEDILEFGKFKGNTIEDTIKTDINYIVWALIEIDEFQLSEESILIFIDNKDRILLNHPRLKNHKAASIAFGFLEGDVNKEFNKNIAEIINKIGRKKF
jgi:hypothetical protein